jgi:adenylate kinase family enzyme
MNRFIIFIDGNMNAGKSTVAKLLARQIDRPAVVEIDELRHFISWMDVRDTIRLNWENALLLTKNFIKNDFNVIVPYPISIDNYNFIASQLVDVDAKLYFITLNPPTRVLLKNRGTRRLSRNEKVRIGELDKNGIAKQEYGLMIDNSKQEAQETVNEILSYISNN